jgi:DNA polymerase (family 10)
MSNQEIAKLFKDIAAAYSIKDEKKFRFQIMAYQKAADTVSSLTSEIIDFYKDDKLNSLPGIGQTIKSHLQELFKTGKVTQFEWALRDIPEAIFPLLDIPSFGPKKAYRLVTEFHLNNPKTVLEDLEKIANQGKIAKMDGFGEKSQNDIIRAITEFRLGKGKTTRMTLPYAAEVADKMVSYLKQSKDVIKAEPLGSLRRKMATIGDIDIAVATNNPRNVLDYFTSYPYKERVIEKGDISSSLLVSGGKQVDLMTSPPEAFGSLLQHFTGSKNHNVHLRELSLKKGLSLSEKGIKNLSKKSLPIQKYASEEKFYEAIGLQWIPPEMREDKGEIELSSQNKLPKLVELSDIKGDLHIHSNFPIEPSHDLGHNTIEEMLEQAVALKYEYLGLSEHNPSISKHNSNSVYSLLIDRNKNIEQIMSSIKDVRILKLLEIDILPNGTLAIDDKSLNTLDGAIVSIHSSFDMNKADMTDRVLKGLSHKKAKILAHPTGRILNERKGYELDWSRIFDFCKKNNKALEINSWPGRLDLPDIIIKMAVDSNVKLVIDTDSHAANEMNLMKYGIYMARRGWATADDILNTLSYNEFSEWLKK